MADQASKKDEDLALAADGEEDALLGGDDAVGGSGGRRATHRSGEEPEFTSGAELDDDDTPAPETGLHALGQLGTAVVVVGVLVLIFLAVALAAGWIFN